jgi:hypothetical protein
MLRDSKYVYVIGMAVFDGLMFGAMGWVVTPLPMWGRIVGLVIAISIGLANFVDGYNRGYDRGARQ